MRRLTAECLRVFCLDVPFVFVIPVREQLEGFSNSQQTMFATKRVVSFRYLELWMSSSLQSVSKFEAVQNRLKNSKYIEQKPKNLEF